MNKRILIVEDNPVNMDIFEEIFEDEFELCKVTTGEEALTSIDKFQPELVLLDVMMPGMDGYETCRRIRSMESYSNVRIIMVSARAMAVEQEKGLAAGADVYVTKPFDDDELLEIVNNQFS